MHAPGVVVDHVGQQQVALGVEAELDLEVDQRAAFELPGLLQHQERLARDRAASPGRIFHSSVARKPPPSAA